MLQKKCILFMLLALCSSVACTASKSPAQQTPRTRTQEQTVTAPAPLPMPAPLRANATRANRVLPILIQANAEAQSGTGVIEACWQPLVARLRAENLANPIIVTAFEDLGDTYAPDPMATKIIELFTISFVKKKPTPKPANATITVSSTPRTYPGVVKPVNIEKCRVFLEEYKTAFAYANATYGVPPEVGVALLFVETRLGKMLGRQNAFWSLASMAATTTPELVMPGLSSIAIKEEHLPWLETKLKERSDWAYKELKALLLHCNMNDVALQQLPGSIYGAVGLCQFMPSNLEPYGADGDADEKINLFTPPDAIASLANYLHKHGWRADVNRDKAHTLLMRYNKSKVYANTILALANGINADVYPLPVKKATPKKPVPKKKPTPKRAATATAVAPKPIATMAKPAAAKPAAAKPLSTLPVNPAKPAGNVPRK